MTNSSTNCNSQSQVPFTSREPGNNLTFVPPKVSPLELFSQKVARRADDGLPFKANCQCGQASVAVPTSLSMNDPSVTVHSFNVVISPSVQPSPMLDQRIGQAKKLSIELETGEGFWKKAELLLQDSWLNGYQGLSLEEKNDLAGAAKAYRRAIKLYAAALKLDRMTARSSPHIGSFYHLLKRYIELLERRELPAEMRDPFTIARVRRHMEAIRNERLNWGMRDPDGEDDPFAYPETLLKVLCS